MWPSLHSHSVHPTQVLISLSRISVTDPTVSIHSSRIFLRAYSFLIVFWCKNPGHSLFSPASSVISSPWPERISATPPLQPFPRPTPCCSSDHQSTPSPPFRVFLTLLHTTSSPSSSPCPRTTSHTQATFFAVSSFSCCSYFWALSLCSSHHSGTSPSCRELKESTTVFRDVIFDP